MVNKKTIIISAVTSICLLSLIITIIVLITKKEDNCNNTMSTYNLEIIPNSHAEIAKGPHWDADTQSLYYTDIYGPALYRYDFKENKVFKCTLLNERISTVCIPIEGSLNQYGVASGRFLKVVDWDGKSSTCKVNRTLFEVEKNYPNNRFNDAKADPKGRFVGGTTHQEKDLFAARVSNLWRWENGKEPVALKTSVGISNGLTWNMEIKKFYYIDSVDFEIKVYDYDIDSGNITNMKILTDFRVNGEKPSFVPDSVALDTNGNLYVALFGDSKVVKVDGTTGKIVQDINIPAEFITSCTFGGPNMDILFVTTASKGEKPAPAGQTFKITGLEAVGVPTYKLKIK